MKYLQESGPSIYRRRRRRRAVITLTFITSLLFATAVYAASYVQGWVGTATPRLVASGACYGATSDQPLTPGGVTINVYNTTARTGLASSVARKLRRQGFEVAAVDNDPLGTSIQGVGEIRHGRTGAASAILAATRLPRARVVQDNRTDATVDLVLGKKFTSLSTPRKGALSREAKPTTPC